MHKKKILSTKNTPEITLNPEGIIRIKGRSMIADMTEFSLQVDDWIDKYLFEPADLTVVDFYLEYLNTNNIIFYINLVRKVETVKLRDKKFIVNWFYEDGDEDIIEKGEAISSSLDIPFNFILISDYRYPHPASDI